MSKAYIILDLEATCWNDRKGTNEIIEIGAVKIIDGKIVDEFQRFVKPILDTTLSDFCKQLTSIKQEDIDSADIFPIVIKEFKDWIGKDYFLCSWGFYDRKQFTADCNLHKIPAYWLINHISIKHQYKDIKKFKEGHQLGLGKALKIEGVKFDGIPHRGIDDAKNIAKIFIKYINDWKY